MDATNIKSRMKATVDAVADEVSRIRVGRATPSIVENIVVPAYGGTQMLRVMELASINIEDTQTIVVRPWDQSVIGEIAKAINNSGLGLNGAIDGEIVRIRIPELTEDRRKEFVKLLGVKIENGKIAIRQVRHDVMADVKKDFESKAIGEDEKFRIEKDAQKITDDAIAEIDAIAKAKEEELMKV